MTKKNNKVVIDKYDLQLYPTDLYVIKGVTEKDYPMLKKRFNIAEEDKVFDAVATTVYGVRDSKTNKICCVIILNTVDKKDLYQSIPVCAHEAGHYAIDLFDHIGMRVCQETSEAFCYFLEWVVGCIYKTLMK